MRKVNVYFFLLSKRLEWYLQLSHFFYNRRHHRTSWQIWLLWVYWYGNDSMNIQVYGLAWSVMNSHVTLSLCLQDICTNLCKHAWIYIICIICTTSIQFHNMYIPTNYTSEVVTSFGKKHTYIICCLAALLLLVPGTSLKVDVVTDRCWSFSISWCGDRDDCWRCRTETYQFAELQWVHDTGDGSCCLGKFVSWKSGKSREVAGCWWFKP